MRLDVSIGALIDDLWINCMPGGGYTTNYIGMCMHASLYSHHGRVYSTVKLDVLYSDTSLHACSQWQDQIIKYTLLFISDHPFVS